jgi:hypothetical protein
MSMPIDPRKADGVQFMQRFEFGVGISPAVRKVAKFP